MGLYRLCWGSTLSLRCHQSKWTCQQNAPWSDIGLLHMGNTFPVKTRTQWGVKSELTLWRNLKVFNQYWRKSNNLEILLHYTKLKCGRLPPYEEEGGEWSRLWSKQLCGNSLTLCLTAMAAGITPKSVYEVNDKEVLSFLNWDIVIWGHSRRSPSLLWSGHVSKAGMNCH